MLRCIDCVRDCGYFEAISECEEGQAIDLWESSYIVYCRDLKSLSMVPDISIVKRSYTHYLLDSTLISIAANPAWDLFEDDTHANDLAPAIGDRSRSCDGFLVSLLDVRLDTKSL